MCSTPCGINEVVTHLPVADRSEILACSTPCGINEVVTGSGRRSIRFRRSAQRLAASTKLSLSNPGRRRRLPPLVLNALRHQRSCHWFHRPIIQKARWLCSTPCGINEVVTIALACRLSMMIQCSTPCGINEVVTAASAATWSRYSARAQRLAASTKLSPFAKPRFSRRRKRAQRLAASTKLSHQSAKACEAGTIVVLNALRHQRSCHWKAFLSVPHSARCSTPCGINEVVTRNPAINPS